MKRAIPKLAASFTLTSCALASQDRLPVLQAAGPGQRIEPRAVARCRIVDGRLQLLGDWRVPAGSIRGPQFAYAFDCFESNTTDPATLAPTDDGPYGCSYVPPGNRWWFGNTYNNPFVSADLTTAPGANGVLCEALVHAWSWVVGALEPDTDGDGQPDMPCFIAIATFESMDTLGCTDDGSGALDGLLLDLGPRPTFWGYYYIALDLSTIGLNLPMPADGEGGYQVMYCIDVPPDDAPVLAPGIDDTDHGVNVQPMLWGTGDAEHFPDNRAGYQNAGQFDDLSPSDGIHSLGCFPDGEGYSYLYGVCPDPLGACTGFLYVVGGDCPCPTDLDGDGTIGLGDLTILLAEFGRTCPCDNACVDINSNGAVDLVDLGGLLSEFGQPCR